jgi:GNAT superfamily N-acetyltransferase
MAITNTPNTYTIRDATAADIPTLCALGTAAVAKFATIPSLAYLVPTGEDTAMSRKVRQSLDNGRIFIAEHQNQPIGFLGSFEMDATTYVAEISVHPDFNGKGVGALLLKAVCAWAREKAVERGEASARVTLTTYEQVAWNGPWYQRRGFKVVDAGTIGPEHVEKMRYDREERDLNRPGYSRCCMLWEEEVSA